MDSLIARLARVVTEARPTIRWYAGRVASVGVYRHAFGSFGRGTTIVGPRTLKGIGLIHIGRDCAIFENVWLQCEPGAGPLTIGDRTYVGHDCHIHAMDAVELGTDCMLADGVFISSAGHPHRAHHSSMGTGAITIGDGVFIGQHAIILGGVSIGSGAVIGAQAVVTSDVPAGSVVAGVPARIIKKGVVE